MKSKAVMGGGLLAAVAILLGIMVGAAIQGFIHGVNHPVLAWCQPSRVLDGSPGVISALVAAIWLGIVFGLPAALIGGIVGWHCTRTSGDRRARRSAMVLFLAGMGTATIFLLWRESPDQKVPRLLQEKRANVGGLFPKLFGRDDRQIDADLDHLGTRAVPALIEALKDPDVQVRDYAAHQLGRIKDRRAVGPLIEFLADPGNIHSWGVAALGDIGDSRAVDSIIPFLKHQHSHDRCLAAEALGKIGDKRAFEPLLPLLEDNDPVNTVTATGIGTVRAFAVDALGNLEDARAFDILIRALQTEKDPYVRSAAARGLGRLGDHRAIPALKKAAEDSSETVNKAAKGALERLQPK
jgi:HEAT repeats/PBS lyase HEAT-like repeat